LFIIGHFCACTDIEVTGFHPALLIFDPYTIIRIHPSTSLSTGFHPELLIFDPYRIMRIYSSTHLPSGLDTALILFDHCRTKHDQAFRGKEARRASIRIAPGETRWKVTTQHLAATL
jgi:hypothetical protein